MEWFAIGIPILVAVFLLIFFRSKVLWWEALIPFVIVLPTIFGIKAISYYSQVGDTEYWGGWVTEIRYYEDWSETVIETYTTTDSKGHTQVRTRMKNVYHPPSHVCFDSNGESFRISNLTYNDLSNKIGGTQLWKDMHRMHNGNDGDMYYQMWSGSDENLIPTVTEHSYVNKIQGSRSIHNYEEVDQEKYELIDYPSTGVFTMPSIIGYRTEDADKADERLRFWNAKLGAKKQVRMWFILFNDKPLEAGLEQEAYWIGGNKNEIVVCIGIARGKVDWCHVFSWSKEEIVKINIRNYIASQNKLDLYDAVEYTAAQVDVGFVKRDFEEFDYIDINMGGWAIFFVYLITILATCGVGAWAVLNDLEDDETFIGRIRYKWKS